MSSAFSLTLNTLDNDIKDTIKEATENIKIDNVRGKEKMKSNRRWYCWFTNWKRVGSFENLWTWQEEVLSKWHFCIYHVFLLQTSSIIFGGIDICDFYV